MVTDQARPAEDDAERSERQQPYSGNPHSILAACRSAGKALKLNPADQPLYAHLLGVAHRLDDPYLSDQHVAGLSNEFRQIVKLLGLDKVPSSTKKEDVNILTSIGSGIRKPTRGA